MLPGCRAEPLLAYLKALGVLRLVATQADASVTARWVGDCLQLTTRLVREELLCFFLDVYRPTPMLAPWNAGSGFWDDQANGQAVQRLRDSTNPRLQPFRDVIAQVERALEVAGLTNRPPAEAKKLLKDKKVDLLRLLRSRLSDQALAWLDATTVLTSEQAKFAPVLGTGGNDGRLEFTPNLIQRLEQVIPFEETGASDSERGGGRGRGRRGAYDRDQSEAWLCAALFGEGAPSLVDGAVGQYHPGGIGGPNATQGFEAGFLVNPWDYVLMMEGVLVLAGAAARRMGVEGGGHWARTAAFPFTVSATAAGIGTYSRDDSERARAEIWLPLWRGNATFGEVQQLFAEGRAQRGRTQAASGLDFAVAATTLGVDRGVRAFQRFGFVQRNGLAFLAAPLGRLEVRERFGGRLIDEVRGWTERVQRAAREHASMTLPVAILERSIFQFCERGGTRELADVAAALGRIERVVSRLPKAREKVKPLALSGRWLAACDDNSTEYRLAASLAGLRWQNAGALRTYLEPVTETRRGWDWDASSTRATWGVGGLARNLAAVLKRRLVEEKRASPNGDGTGDPAEANTKEKTASVPVRASARDVAAFLVAETVDSRLEDLTWALSCVSRSDRGDWAEIDKKYRDAEDMEFRFASGQHREGAVLPTKAEWLGARLPRVYLLLKLLFLESPLRRTDESEAVSIRAEAGVLNALSAGQVARAVELAGRRLWASGLAPLAYSGGRGTFETDHASPGVDPVRLAAALAFPVADMSILVELVLRRPSANS